jgi:hypothetical protein
MDDPNDYRSGERREMMALKLKETEKIQAIIASGYAGILPNGNIVDRREYPDAVTVQKNTLLDVPEPK